MGGFYSRKAPAYYTADSYYGAVLRDFTTDVPARCLLRERMGKPRMPRKAQRTRKTRNHLRSPAACVASLSQLARMKFFFVVVLANGGCTATVSVIAFQCIKESGSPFLCFCCHQIRSQDVSAQLTNKVQQLEEEIRGLKTALNSAAHHSQQPSQLAGTVTQDPPRRSYASVAGPSGESDSNPVLKQEPNSDKKFNIVIYGIDECPKGMTRSERL